jgi:hypothetical protein
MTQITKRSRRHNRLQAAALVGVLSLSLLPVAAQMPGRNPGMPPVLQSPPIHTGGSVMGPPPMMIHPGPMPGTLGSAMGGIHTFNRAPMPDYGGTNGGNLFNHHGVDFNSVFQRGPEPNLLRAPSPIQNEDLLNRNRNGLLYRGDNGLLSPGNFTLAPARTQNQLNYSTRAVQPTFNVRPRYAPHSHSSGDPAYRYDSSHRLHYLAGAGWGIYFPFGAAYYPYYYPDYTYGLTVPSMYYYYGTFPPYIGANYVMSQPPQYGYVPTPDYTPDGQYSGDQPDDLDNYYLNRNQGQDAVPSRQQDNSQGSYKVGESTVTKDAVLDNAVADIDAAWKTGDIQMLAKHIRRDARVAVYLRGKYQYSLDAGDYLDMTRDAFRATRTVSFTLDKVQRKEKGVYTVSGRHTYMDQKDKNHTVLVNYVLEKGDDEYYITQVGTSPEKLEE